MGNPTALPFDPAAVQRAVQKAGRALRETLDNMARKRQAQLAARSPERIDRDSAKRLKQHIEYERSRGRTFVMGEGLRATLDLGLLPDCPLFDAGMTTRESHWTETRKVTWCGKHHSRSDHPRWCRVALGFDPDGGLKS